MKFDLKKLSISAVAGLVIGLGVGGSLGAGAGAVISYDAHSAALKDLKRASDDPAVSKEQMRDLVDYAVDSFKSIEVQAKKALGQK